MVEDRFVHLDLVCRWLAGARAGDAPARVLYRVLRLRAVLDRMESDAGP
jgi:hypothetical protein